ncbi:hypothetical protein [Streptococcus cristatus]|uniref:hypothetical protein n=1 Tax=Streptococcus cristatus TaxID=45634 RepID=UPI000785B37F|nr:hypothetical protein [Streptococcus cristatus]
MKKYRNLYSSKNKLPSSYLKMTGIIFEFDNRRYVVENIVSKSELQYLSDLHKIRRVLLYISDFEPSNCLHYEQDKSMSRKKRKLKDENIYKTLSDFDKDSIGFPRKKNGKTYSGSFIEKLMTLDKVNTEFVYDTVTNQNFLKILIDSIKSKLGYDNKKLQDHLINSIINLAYYNSGQKIPKKKFKEKFYREALQEAKLLN